MRSSSNATDSTVSFEMGSGQGAQIEGETQGEGEKTKKGREGAGIAPRGFPGGCCQGEELSGR